MGIFTALRNWFGGRPSLSVVSADMSAPMPDLITEPTAISVAHEANIEETPVRHQFDYSPVVSVEVPVSPLTPITTTAPEISVPAISTTESSIETRPKPRSRTTKPKRSTRARAKRSAQ
ncbi:MAG: hypothetical protein FJ358_01765 [Thaumarchaeota archaeon]|nr:hypothetical protein [Nitrososphaerota archaeon]